MAQDGNKRDWSTGLPDELLHLIYKKLPDIRDFVRFRAVCKSWCSSAPLSDPPEQQLPWLLDAWFDNIFEGSVLAAKHMFYSISYGAMGSLHIDPRHHGKPFRGPCLHYLLLGYEHEKYFEGECFALFNPLTNAYILLAHLPQSFFPDEGRTFGSYFPIWTDDRDPLSKEIIGVFFEPHNIMGRPAIYNLQSKKWFAVNCRFDFTACCYMKGMLFATSLYDETCIFCEKSLQLLDKVPPPVMEKEQHLRANYLIPCSEVILLVCWAEELCSKSIKTLEFIIYRLDYHAGTGKHHNWVQISDIGDQMLFLGETNGFVLRARPADGFRGNCIYFLYPWPYGRPYSYDIATGRVEQIPCPFRECKWFMPSLH